MIVPGNVNSIGSFRLKPRNCVRGQISPSNISVCIGVPDIDIIRIIRKIIPLEGCLVMGYFHQSKISWAGGFLGFPRAVERRKFYNITFMF
ncbi:hypothetical protein D3C77_430370 [compost metagenome]